MWSQSVPDRLRRELLDNPGFAPLAQTEIKRWYNLVASTAVASEWETVVESFGGTPLTQVGAVRKPAADVSANGLPVATFDGTDVWRLTLESGNNSTAQWWMYFRIKPFDFGASQQVLSMMNGADGVAANRQRISVSNTTGRVSFDIFVSGFNGRNYATAGGLTVSAYNGVYVQFDGLGSAECDLTGSDTTAKTRIAIGNTFQALTPSDQGTGGVPTALLATTGFGTFGAASNTDTAIAAMRPGTVFGPAIFFGDVPLSAAKLANLNAFLVPT